jgi:hypothetical protein
MELGVATGIMRTEAGTWEAQSDQMAAARARSTAWSSA